MNIDDIQGAKSRRLYRGHARDIFKITEIEGAHPHKPSRSPRSYAFDDYKDVTSARKYRRPFMNQIPNIEQNYFSRNSRGAPQSAVLQNTYNASTSRNNNVDGNNSLMRKYTKSELDYKQRLWAPKMNYYDLPRINRDGKNIIF